MMENHRIFPRYKTAGMKIQIAMEDIDTADFTAQNVSLGGLKISTSSPIKFQSSHKMVIKLGSQEFQLNAFPVWNRPITEQDNTVFNYGFRLVFQKEDDYRRWLTFMKALHQHKKNLKN